VAKYAYHRIYANAKAIRDALEAVGATVDVRSPADFLVGFRGQNWIVEVKTKTGKLRPSQAKFQAGWRGQYAVIRSPEDAVQLIGAVK